MSAEPDQQRLDILLKEYEKLKDEQIQRTGFRDNMLYVTLVAVGGVVSIAFGAGNDLAPLLLVPWICVILGWTYLVNDEKISAIGRYIRLELSKRIGQVAGTPEAALFGWEVAHRTDTRRASRKWLQFGVDELTFCLSGIAAVIIYLIFDTKQTPFTVVLGVGEIILLIVLGIQIALYAELRRERR